MNTNSSGQSSKMWRTALYVRLSKEDEGSKKESYSVTSQKEILKEYVKQHPDMSIFDIYVDDGFSGTNFDRPAFKRMLSHIEKGLVNCVIVKDLSRFCRNAVDGGYYLDNVFTRLQVRFIAINNCIDTFSPSMNASTRCITLGVQNVINESVAATTSVNVRGTLNMTREKGQFIGSFPSYGYLKDPIDHHKLIVDPEAAEVVKEIFSMFLNGKSVIGIAKDLNMRGIPNPTLYKKLKGFNYNHPSKDINDGLWPDSSVRRILKNRMYTGAMVQGRTTTISYKIKKCRTIPPDEWIVVENTHEPIIDKETFLQAQALFSKNSRSDNKTYEKDIFSGIVKCGICKRPMNKKTNIHPYGTYVYYKCSSGRKNPLSKCQNFVRRDKIYDAVLSSLQKLSSAFLEKGDISAELNKLPKKEEGLKLSLKEAENRKEKLLKNLSSLYSDWKEGLLTKEEYLFLKDDFAKEISSLEEKMKASSLYIKEREKEREEKEKAILSFTKYGKIEKLTRLMVTELIDEILIYPDDRIEIYFKFRDSLK